MTNSQGPSYKIGARIECAGSFGTVKYIGSLEGKSLIWLGIDWDDAERGKHDGTVNGVQYFVASYPTSGSFVRPEKVNFGRSALKSIESRYGREEDEFTAKINQQKRLLIQQTMNAPFLEMVGFDKVFNKQSNFNTLQVINLRNQNVSSAGNVLNLGATCPNVEELDISKNLLVSWEDVLQMCDQLPKLHWLNVSENVLSMPDAFEEKQYPKLRTLICGSMGLSWSDICRISNVFPNLEELRAPYNKIANLCDMRKFFTQLTLLDIEGNKIVEWSEICKLGSAPRLEQLIIENIGLQSIEFEGTAEKVPIFRSLKKLCIVKNFINEWRSIGELNRLENLEHLRVLKNPITESEDHDRIHMLIIAKIANLKILNGVEIEAGERKGAEYDYIKKYGLEWLKVKSTEEEASFLKSHSRYLELIQKYGEPEESELQIKPKMINASLINLKLIFEDRSIEKKMPPTLTVQKLMMLVQKLFRLNERPSLTYISSTDANIEILLEDELKEIGVYSMQSGDKIIVKQ